VSFSLFKIFALFGIISAWADKALADGKVTLVEAVDLVSRLCAVLGITPELELPGSEPVKVEVNLQPSGTSGEVFDNEDQTSEERASPEAVPDKIEGAA